MPITMNCPKWSLWAAAVLVGPLCLEARAAEPAPRFEGRIAGRVLIDADGSAAAGAAVRLLLPVPADQPFHSWPLPIRQATADEKGNFAFEGLPPGKYQLWANDATRTSRRRRLEGVSISPPNLDGAVVLADLRLRDAVTLTVAVTAKDTGKPLPGAVVAPQFSDLDGQFVTGENGEAVVGPLTAEVWTIDVWADGYTRQSRILNFNRGEDAQVKFSLEPGGVIEGVVRDGQGAAVAGARVSATQGQQIYGRATSADDGSFQLRHVTREGAVELSVFAAHYATQRQSVVISGGAHHVDFVLAPDALAGPVQGIVLDSKGQPIAGARLTNSLLASDEVREAVTGSDGRFRFDEVLIGQNETSLAVRANGFAPRRVVIEPGTTDAPGEVKISLEAGHRIAGRVADEEGRPLDGVRVSYGAVVSPLGVGGRAETNEDGRFELDSLPDECTFSFYKPGYSNIHNRPLTLDVDGAVTIVLSPTGILRGRVVDASTGQPLRDFNVRAAFTRRRSPREPAGGVRSDLANSGETVQSRDGTFDVSDLALGMSLKVIVEAEGYHRLAIDPVKTQSADRAAVVEFRLTAEDPADFVDYVGRLLDDAGKPLVGVELRLIAAEEQPNTPANGPYVQRFAWQQIRNGRVKSDGSVLRFESAASDSRGAFHFARVPRAAVVELVWWKKGVSAGRREHLERLSDDELARIEIRPPRPARLTGRIDRAAYPDVARVILLGETSGPEGEPVRLTPEQETFEFVDVPPGKYRVSLAGLGEPVQLGPAGGLGRRLRPLATAQVTLEPGADERVEFGKEEK